MSLKDQNLVLYLKMFQFGLSYNKGRLTLILIENFQFLISLIFINVQTSLFKNLQGQLVANLARIFIQDQKHV
jgi:hypothetical protein